MSSVLTPPAPPTLSLDSDKRLELYKQMLSDLEAKFAYQQQSIAYHSESLKLLESNAKSTQEELEACRKIITSLTSNVKTKTTAPSNGHKPQAVIDLKEEVKVKETVETKANKNGKAKASIKSKKAKAKPKTKTKTKTSSTKTKGKVVTKSKSLSTLPPSKVIDKFQSITDMVLDFVSQQEGVISVSDVINYAYPDGLDEQKRKKAASSFSSVLGLQTKKGKLERTIPGKYMWRGK